MRQSRSRLLAAVVLQSLVLVGMIAARQYTLSSDIEITLDLEPIDPRSLFRGDFVRLNYDINTLEPGDFPVAEPLRAGGDVYVVLEDGEPNWTPVSAHATWPETAAGQIVIKGRVESRTWRSAVVRYGIESYFIPEGEGRAIERPPSGHDVSVQIAVDSWDNAAIKAVLVNGIPRYAETLF